MHRMTFGWLTLGFGLLGLIAVEIFIVIVEAVDTPPQDGLQIQVISPGAELVIGGVVGFIGGTLLGVCVWAVWRALRWFAPSRFNRGGSPTLLGVLVAVLAAVVASGCGSGSAVTGLPSSTCAGQRNSTSLERPDRAPVHAYRAFLVKAGGEVHLVEAAEGGTRLVALGGG